MHLVGQVASVLASGPDNGSGEEVTGDLLVGLLLHPRGGSGSGVDGELNQMLPFWGRVELLNCAGGTVY